MKSLIIIVLTLCICGCKGAYKNDDKLIQKAYHDGYEMGKQECADADTLPLFIKMWNKINQPKVQSITFKYDSIIILKFDSSEIK